MKTYFWAILKYRTLRNTIGVFRILSISALQSNLFSIVMCDILYHLYLICKMFKLYRLVFIELISKYQNVPNFFIFLEYYRLVQCVYLKLRKNKLEYSFILHVCVKFKRCTLLTFYVMLFSIT